MCWGRIHGELIDVEDHLPFVDFVLTPSLNCQSWINGTCVDNTCLTLPAMCVNVFSAGTWAQLEKRPAAGWGSVKGWLMLCFMSFRQPWAQARSTARFDLSLFCLSMHWVKNHKEFQQVELNSVYGQYWDIVQCKCTNEVKNNHIWKALWKCMT